MSTSEPLANRTAQDDVEKALAVGRAQTDADRRDRRRPAITVRKGNGKVVQPTVTGEPTNDLPW